MSLHFCGDGGYVVGADLPVGEDVSDYQAGAAILGCNRLKCGRCGEIVRQRAEVDCPRASKRAKELFETADWTTLEYVKQQPGYGRLYACRCTAWHEPSYHVCADPDPEPSSNDPRLPWRCAGHPVATLPITIDGQPISTDMDWAALVVRVLGGWSPDKSPPPSPWSPSAWLYRLRKRLADLPESERVAEAAARCLADPLRRGGALAYFCSYPRDVAFEHVVALAAKPEELVRRTLSIAKQGPGIEYWPAKALRCRLFSVRGELDALDAASLRLLQGAAVRGEVGLEREDFDGIRCVAALWLAEQAGDIARAHPARTLQLLEALSDLEEPNLLTIAGVALAREPGSDHAALRGWLDHWANKDRGYARVIATVLNGMPTR